MSQKNKGLKFYDKIGLKSQKVEDFEKERQKHKLDTFFHVNFLFFNIIIYSNLIVLSIKKVMKGLFFLNTTDGYR